MCVIAILVLMAIDAASHPGVAACGRASGGCGPPADVIWGIVTVACGIGALPFEDNADGGKYLTGNFVNQFGINRAIFTLAANNVAVLWTRYGGHDPEINFHGDATFSRVDSWTAPNFRRISGSLSIDF